MSEPFVYKGMPGYIASEGLKPSFAARIHTVWFVQRVNDALSQIPHSQAKDRAEMYKVVRESIVALTECVNCVTKATDDVMANFPPLPSEDDPAVDRKDPLATVRPVITDHEPIKVDHEPIKRGPGRPRKDDV